jgi:WhiB family transcriptional regulator, redox-sensing transcriptional regulator
MTAGRVLQIVLETAKLKWMDEGLCAQVDPEIWFPEKGNPTAAAKAICRRCPSRQPCLQYALDNNIRFGVWGATSERQRRDMRPERSAAA